MRLNVLNIWTYSVQCRMLQSYEKLLIHRTQTLTVKVLINGPLLASGQASGVSCWGDGSSSQGTILRLQVSARAAYLGPMLCSAPLVSGCSRVSWRRGIHKRTICKRVGCAWNCKDPSAARLICQGRARGRQLEDWQQTGPEQRQEDSFLPEKGVCCEE